MIQQFRTLASSIQSVMFKDTDRISAIGPPGS
jgi:hypothetical protein